MAGFRRKARRALQAIDQVSETSGWSRLKTALRMFQAKRRHGIGIGRYAANEFHRIPVEELSKYSGTRSSQVEFVAQKRGISYEDARSLMDRVRDQHGITHVEFVRRDLWKFKNEKGLQRRLERLQERDVQYVKDVVEETGWTFDEAESKMRAARDRWPAVTFRKYAAFSFHGMTDDEIDVRIKEWNATAARDRGTVMRESGWPEKRVREHMTHVEAAFGIIPAYYMCYRAWELSDEQLATYATVRHSRKLSYAFNTPEALAMGRHKERFDETFAEYLNRKFWLNREGSTFEEFQAFATGVPRAFCKLLRSGGGVGAFAIALPVDPAALRSVYDDLMAKPLLLVEEELIQHPAMAAVYPGSVNSIRVVAIIDEGTLNIISTGAQFGHREVTDNFTNDGMVCDVDTATGTITTAAVDRDGVVYETHPITGERFEGFTIPNWELVLSTVTKAMGVYPGLNYVGWDIAILPEAVSILEANTEPDPCLLQAEYAPARIGKRYLYDPYLKKIGR